MSRCCYFYQKPRPGTGFGLLGCISAFTCIVRQALGVPGALCGCCELARRRIVGVQ